ncbi:hypothetical protein AOLI_G00138570 [Acnodon oligacanthus]
MMQCALRCVLKYLGMTWRVAKANDAYKLTYLVHSEQRVIGTSPLRKEQRASRRGRGRGRGHLSLLKQHVNTPTSGSVGGDIKPTLGPDGLTLQVVTQDLQSFFLALWPVAQV